MVFLCIWAVGADMGFGSLARWKALKSTSIGIFRHREALAISCYDIWLFAVISAQYSVLGR